MSVKPPEPLHVLVATPLGEGGAGGIDRMMDGLRHAVAADPPDAMRVTFLATRGKGSLLLSPLHLLRFIATMLWLRLRGRCDVVHINLASNGSAYRKMVIVGFARAAHVPYVMHLHGAVFREFFLQAPQLRRRIIARVFRGAALVLVLGTVWRRFVCDEMSVDPSHAIILPNASLAARTAHCRNVDGVARLLFLGRLGERKGVLQLFEALAKLPPDARWRATLAGDGPVMDMRAMAARLGLESQVEVLGWRSPGETEALLASSDILVLPSFAENLPMSVIEGMAAGLAVVTTPVGATPDIIEDGVTGLLVPLGDAAALAAALSRLVAEPDLRARLGNSARRFHGEHLEIGSYARRLATIWREAVE